MKASKIPFLRLDAFDEDAEHRGQSCARIRKLAQLRDAVIVPFLESMLYESIDDGFLGRIVVVERPLGDIHRLGDLLHGDGFEAVLVEQPDCPGDDPACGFLPFFFPFVFVFFDPYDPRLYSVYLYT